MAADGPKWTQPRGNQPRVDGDGEDGTGGRGLYRLGTGRERMRHALSGRPTEEVVTHVPKGRQI